MGLKSFITTATVVTVVATNVFYISPLTAHALEITPEPVNSALVAPLGVSYTLPGYEHADAKPEDMQRLTVPDISSAQSVVDIQTEVIKTLPKIEDLTAENTYALTEQEYTQVISEGRSFDVQKVIKTAYRDVSNSYPTGWNQEGECIMSVARWMKTGGASWGPGGTPMDNYTNAKRVPLDNLQAGDVIQYINKANPTDWASGIHTVLITGNNWDGTYKIVEANAAGGPGVVSKDDKWKPKPPTGFEAYALRF